MSLLKTTFITKNSIGKISKITRDIFNRGININKSQMVTHRNLLIFNTEYYNPMNIVIDDIITKYNFTDLNEIFDPSYHTKKYYYKRLMISCSDTPGIIHDTSDLCSKLNININSLDTNCHKGAMSCVDIFNLNVYLEIPEHIREQDLKNKMSVLVDKYGIEIDFGNNRYKD